MASTPLEGLGPVRLASPCNEDWSRMVGGSRTRFCAKCSKRVHDLSGLTADEVRRLLNVPPGAQPPCIRFYVRKDGTMLTADCPVGFAGVRRELRRKALALACLLIAGVSAAYSRLASGLPLLAGLGASREGVTTLQQWFDERVRPVLPVAVDERLMAEEHSLGVPLKNVGGHPHGGCNDRFCADFFPTDPP